MNANSPALLVCLLVSLSMGCEGDPNRGPGDGPSEVEPGSVPIVELSAFVEVAPERDPFADAPTERGACVAWGLEETYLEVSTGGCPYVTLTAPSLQALPAGTTLAATAWRTPLTAPEAGAVAHLELRFGEVVLLSHRIAIPASDEVYSSEVTLAEAVPAATPLFVHVHNHGANTYRFTPVVTRP